MGMSSRFPVIRITIRDLSPPTQQISFCFLCPCTPAAPSSFPFESPPLPQKEAIIYWELGLRAQDEFLLVSRRI